MAVNFLVSNLAKNVSNASNILICDNHTSKHSIRSKQTNNDSMTWTTEFHVEKLVTEHIVFGVIQWPECNTSMFLFLTLYFELSVSFNTSQSHKQERLNAYALKAIVMRFFSSNSLSTWRTNVKSGSLVTNIYII